MQETTPPHEKKPKKVWVWLGGTSAALAVGYALAWAVTAWALSHHINSWVEAQRTRGFTVSMAPTETSGFPGPITLTVRDVAVRAPAANGGWSYEGPGFSARTWPLGWWWLTIELPGRHVIAGGFTPPDPPVGVALEAASLKLRLGLLGGLRTAVFSTTGLVAAVKDLPPIARLSHGTMRFDLLSPIGGPEPDGQSPTLPVSARLTADLTDLSLPGLLPAPLDQPVTHAKGTVEITGTLSSGPLPQVLEAWRGQGGTVEAREVEVDWPPLRLSGSGTLALDENLQPLGAFSARIQGGGEAVDALAKAGWMDTDQAGLAHLALAAVSRKGEDGVTPELNVPFTLQDRRVSAGPVTVMEVPRITWSDVVVP